MMPGGGEGENAMREVIRDMIWPPQDKEHA
jgi:hypothetical protein